MDDMFMIKWGAEIVSNVLLPGAEMEDGSVPIPEDNSPLSEAMYNIFTEVEAHDCRVHRCVIRLDRPVITITATTERHVYNRHGNLIIGHMEGTVCSECGAFVFQKHPLNGCKIVVIEGIMGS